MSNMDSLAFENSAIFKEYNKKLSEMDNAKLSYEQASEAISDLKIIAQFEKLEADIKNDAQLREKIAHLQMQLQDPELAKNFHPKFAEAIMMLNLEKA